MRDDHKGSFPDAQVREAIPKVMEAKKERLTGNTILAKVKKCAIGFLKVAGIVVYFGSENAGQFALGDLE